MREFDPKPGCKRLDNILLTCLVLSADGWVRAWYAACRSGARLPRERSAHKDNSFFPRVLWKVSAKAEI